MEVLKTITGIFEMLIFIVYLYAGDRAIYYLKYHILNTRAELYSNTGDYIISRIIWALLLGWVAIPLTFLHKMMIRR